MPAMPGSLVHHHQLGGGPQLAAMGEAALGARGRGLARGGLRPARRRRQRGRGEEAFDRSSAVKDAAQYLDLYPAEEVIRALLEAPVLLVVEQATEVTWRSSGESWNLSPEAES
jgi:hypothetical protein